MMSASELVRWLREESGLSQRAIARRAGCSRSTILRIEAGEMDPTVTMLARIAAAAGRRLAIDVPAPVDGPRLADVAERADHIETVDWTRLRGIVDWLHEHPDHVDRVVNDPPARSPDPALDNLLAGIAEKAADDAGRRRPLWTSAVPPLAAPWHPPGTPRMQAAEAATAPPQLAARNLHLGAANLWRDG